MKFARDHLADPSMIKTPRDQSLIANLEDIYLKGIEKFQSIFREEDWNETPCRFNSGAAGIFGAEFQRVENVQP
jgi:hypothetical protein